MIFTCHHKKALHKNQYVYCSNNVTRCPCLQKCKVINQSINLVIKMRQNLVHALTNSWYLLYEIILYAYISEGNSCNTKCREQHAKCKMSSNNDQNKPGNRIIITTLGNWYVHYTCANINSYNGLACVLNVNGFQFKSLE